ncbi:hypothetical protein [Ruminococcus sp. YRD2003]|uniref:hypothetical protein n=1 Tax=Ruminococcus sp. YRD2003 TaxID=1452313 RepID=UPI00115FE2BE
MIGNTSAHKVRGNERTSNIVVFKNSINHDLVAGQFFGKFECFLAAFFYSFIDLIRLYKSNEVRILV